jgi:bifunctional ADP-heptose synthase (sugar kinase/adenylyltransferase)
MDTRSKILSPAAAGQLAGQLPPNSVTVVTGYFDVLRAEHARDLREVRERAPAQPLLVVVLPLAGELLQQRARAELVAALHMVDYVVITDETDAAALIASLKPAALVRLEGADVRRIRQLTEHVHRRQTS